MEVIIQSGKVRGRSVGGVTAFLGIPFAQAERFAPPRPVQPWSGVRDAFATGPAAPQANFGPPPMPAWPDGTCDEDACLTINVWSPNPDGGPKPVLFWIHGGGCITGSASMPCYHGGELARAGDIVVVTANHRVGALGYLYIDGGNFGLLDQIAALRWTHDNIAAFGGDPDLITVGGQSAGGMATLFLMANPDTRPLFQRALLQSSVPPESSWATLGPATAMESRRRFETLLAEDVHTASWQRIVEVGASMRPPGMIAPPFTPAIGGSGISASPLEADLSGFDVLAGWTADEATMFGKSPGDTLGFEEGTPALAQRQAADGHPAFVYRFDWQGPPPWYATHCIDLPFLFGNNAVWADSPMLAGSTEAERLPVVEAFQDAVCRFVREGDPGGDWQPYLAGHPTIRPFDRVPTHART